MTIHPVGLGVVPCGQTDGPTDRTNLIIAFRNFAKRLKTESVPRSKHFVCITETSQLMLYREVISLCCTNRIKHTNALRGQNIRVFNVNVVERDEATRL
jgi:hypothetical protein